MLKDYFQNKKIVIVGATGGLGRAYAHAFYREGAQLFLLGRNKKKLANFVQEFPYAIPHCTVDTRNETSIQKAAETIQVWSDQVDMIINATGVDVRKSLSAHSVGEIEETLTIDLFGAILLTKYFLPLLSDKQDSVLVHSGGFADGRLAFPYYSVDVASRAGLFSFIESMNRELKQEGEKKYLAYFCPNAADTPSEAPYHPIWREMKIPISRTDEVCRALFVGLKRRKKVILMGRGVSFFAKLNLLSPRLADFLLLNKYSRILKKHFG